MGEYYASDSIRKGLPILRDAALSGSLTAMRSYLSVVNTAVHQEYIGDPLDRPMTQGSQESLLFTFVHSLRTGGPKQGTCESLLLNTEEPLTKDMFFSQTENDDDWEGPCINDYRFHILSLTEIEGVINQAKAWKGCWD